MPLRMMSLPCTMRDRVNEELLAGLGEIVFTSGTGEGASYLIHLSR